MRMLIVAMTAIAGISVAEARPADCLLIVGGVKRIDGVCEFRASPTGLQITSISGPLIFAQVDKDDQGEAFGFWNEEPGSNHAHSSLGEMRRDGACWVSSTARVCAWKIGEPRTWAAPERRSSQAIQSVVNDEFPIADVEADCTRQSMGNTLTFNACLAPNQSAYDDVKAIWGNIPSSARRACKSRFSISQGHYYIAMRSCLVVEAEKAEIEEMKKSRGAFRY